MNYRNVLLLVACGVSGFMLLVVPSGCHRGFYRRQADTEVSQLIREKLTDPRWDQIRPGIEVSPESRMADLFSADHPPLPPDDPASHELMHNVDDKPGYQHWHVNGDTAFVANPEWRSYLPLNQEGVLVLDIDTAVRLSLIHSRELQEQHESLYLSALDVSIQRFGFDTQGFYGLSSFFRTQGRSANGGANSSVTLGAGPSRTRLQKLGISGANLVVGIANTIVWNFGGANTQTASTIIDFSLIQPLLRGAGRQVVMESLTQAERTLLANVRQLERFRRGFNLNITTGRSAGAGVNQGGNFLSQPGSGSGTAGGFLGLLQSQQQIRIEEFRVQSLKNVVEQFNEFFEEDRINLLQVRQAENSLYTAQQRLLGLLISYQNQMDTFKRTLGLPPQLQVEIRDPFLKQFELIDEELLQRQFEVNELRNQVGVALSRINSTGTEGGSFSDSDELEWNDAIAKAVADMVPVLDKAKPFFEQFAGADRDLVMKDFDRLDSVTDDRLEGLKKLRESIESGEIKYDIQPSILEASSVASVGQLKNELTELLLKVEKIRADVGTVVSNLEKMATDGPNLEMEQLKDRLKDEIVYEAPEVLTRLADAVVELTLLQARARTNSIMLPEVEIDARKATAIACQFRRDLMNARASLVDRWRQIELVADDLESTLDVVFEGSVGSSTDNPFKINWNTNTFGMGLRFDAPITRQTERNQYRQTLINYQQARRDYYNIEDAISQNLRRNIRSIEQNKVLFELNRRSIATAIQQVELAQFEIAQPARSTAGGAGIGPTASRNLTDALTTLQQSQTGFLQNWVEYEVLRRDLDFDLGTMQLSPEGDWMDPGTINVEYAFRVAEAYGIPPESLCIPADSDVAPFDPVQIINESMAPEQAPGQNRLEYFEGSEPTDINRPTVSPESDLEAPNSVGQRLRGRFSSLLASPVLENSGKSRR